MKTDYSQYVGREVVITTELLGDVYTGDRYEPDCIPKWNYVGNVLTITNYNTHTEAFGFVDQNGEFDEVLFNYDFEHGYVELLPEIDEIQLDQDAISLII